MKRFVFIFLSLFFTRQVEGTIYHYETAVAKFLQPITLTEADSGIEGIDCVYLINLDHRPEKWMRAKKLLGNRGVKINRISAINGWKFSEEERKELSGPYLQRFKGGDIGCLLSHVSILKDAYRRGFERIWVLEDDIDIVNDINKIPLLLDELYELDPEWDIFYTDRDFRDEKQGYIVSVGADFRPDRDHPPLEYFLEKKRVSENIIKIGQRFGTRSFCVSRKGVEKILNYFTHVYLWTSIDIDIHYIPGIREYASYIDIVSNRRIRKYRDVANNMSVENH